MNQISIFKKFAVLLGLLLPSSINGHGALVSVKINGINDWESGTTGSRNYQQHKLCKWPCTDTEHDPYSMNGIGGRVDEYNNPGGEPGQAPPRATPWYGGLEDKWFVGDQGHFKPGDEVTFGVKITANHGGIFEFRSFCADGKKSAGITTIDTLDFYDFMPNINSEQQCMDLNIESNLWREGTGCYTPRVMQRVSKGTEANTVLSSRPEWYILSKDPQCFTGEIADNVFEMTYQLPSTACEHLVVQWWWQTSNNCVFKTWAESVESNIFPCNNGAWHTSGMGACNPMVPIEQRKVAAGEQFANLIDFKLSSSPCTSCDTPTIPTTTKQAIAATTGSSIVTQPDIDTTKNNIIITTQDIAQENKFVSATGDFEVTWQVSDDIISFSFQGPNDGYIALGFKKEAQRMDDMDVYMGSNGKSVTDRYADRFNTPSLDTASGGSNDVLASSCSVDNTQKLGLKCSFERKLTTGDNHDLDLNNNALYIVYAYGSGDADTPQFHQSNKGFSKQSYVFASHTPSTAVPLNPSTSSNLRTTTTTSSIQKVTLCLSPPCLDSGSAVKEVSIYAMCAFFSLLISLA